jgi:hypothetical protein
VYNAREEERDQVLLPITLTPHFGCRYWSKGFGIGIVKLPIPLFGWLRIRNGIRTQYRLVLAILPPPHLRFRAQPLLYCATFIPPLLNCIFPDAQRRMEARRGGCPRCGASSPALPMQTRRSPMQRHFFPNATRPFFFMAGAHLLCHGRRAPSSPWSACPFFSMAGVPLLLHGRCASSPWPACPLLLYGRPTLLVHG